MKILETKFTREELEFLDPILQRGELGFGSNVSLFETQFQSFSGKTYNILLWIIFHYCTNNNNKTVTICRKSFPSLRASVMRDFLNILKQYKS